MVTPWFSKRMCWALLEGLGCKNSVDPSQDTWVSCGSVLLMVTQEVSAEAWI